MASLSVEAMASFRLSDELEGRLSRLLSANQAGKISTEELADLDDDLRLEHLMRMMKYRAYLRLKDK